MRETINVQIPVYMDEDCRVVSTKPVEVEEIINCGLHAHYFGNRFRSLYNVKFAMGIDGVVYRTAPANTPNYPEEYEDVTQWLKNDDVTFCQDTHITNPYATA